MNQPAQERKWLARLAMRLGQMEQGRVYSLLIFVPSDGEDPVWSVIGEGKIEESDKEPRRKYRKTLLE